MEFLRKPWQIVTGTPSEHAAIAEKNRLTTALRATNLTHQKRTTLETERDEQAALAHPLTRRRWITGAAGLLLAAVPTGLVVRSLTTEGAIEPVQFYDGPIEQMRGLPELSAREIDALTDELKKTDNSLFAKAARDIKTVTGKEPVTDGPSELIKPTAFPLKITRNSNTSESLAIFDPENTDTPNPYFVFIPAEGESEVHPFENTYNLGIILGTQGYDLDPYDMGIVEAILATKEVLSLTSTMRFADDAYGFYSSQGDHFFDEEGNIIDDPALQRRASMAKFLHSMRDEKGMLTTDYLVLDGLPIMALTYAVQDCIARHVFDPSALRFNSMDIVSNYMFAPDVYGQASALFETWAYQDSLLPQPGLMDAVHRKGSPLREAIIGFQNEIYGYNLHD